MQEKLIRFFTTRLKVKQSFLILFFLYILSYYKLLTCNYLYADDQGRKYMGYHGWLDWSRWTNTLLSNIIHTDTFLSDISPLPQIMACALLALASLLAVQIIFGEKEVSLIGIVPSLMLGVNPYFLGCMSYKYDSIYMAISVLASIVPMYYWIFAKNEKPRTVRYISLSVLCLLVMLTSYQSSAGIYPMLVAIIALKELFKKDDFNETLKFIAFSVISYLLSLLIFVAALMMHRSDSGNWAPISSIQDLFLNYSNHYSIVFQDSKLIWTGMALILLTVLAIQYVAHYNGNKLKGFLYFALGLFGISLVAFGANLFILEKKTLLPRYMYGVDIAIAFLILLLLWIFSVNSINNPGKKQAIFQNVIFCIAGYLTYCFVIFSCIYGNELEAQWEYNVFRVQEVVNDLTDLEIMMNGQDKNVSIVGNIGYAPALDNYPDMNLSKKILPTPFSSGNIWHEFYFRYYFDVPNMRTAEIDEKTFDPSDYTLLHESVYHRIYCNDNNDVIIVLNDPQEIKWDKGSGN